MELSTRNRRALSTILAVFLAVETVSAVAAAAATRTVTHELPAATPAGGVLAAEALPRAAVDQALELRVSSAPRGSVRVVEPATAAAIVPAVPAVPAAVASAREAASAADRKPEAKDTATRVKVQRSTGSTTATGAPKADRASSGGKAPSGGKTSYQGTNHVWIPSLGINRSVRWFPCERSRPPDNYMYRWGCAGANNVYLMGHAYSVMKPLHDAYVSGRLAKGMKAWYADGNGQVRVYAVRWWKVVRPTTDAAWAWAPLATPSMTLQTCVGKNSEYRLMVRLTEAGG